MMYSLRGGKYADVEAASSKGRLQLVTLVDQSMPTCQTRMEVVLLKASLCKSHFGCALVFRHDSGKSALHQLPLVYFLIDSSCSMYSLSAVLPVTTYGSVYV